MQRPFVVLACGLQGFLFKGVIIYSIYSLESACFFSTLLTANIYNGEDEKHTIHLYYAFRHYVLCRL